jgi:hypothetical protein
LADRVELGEGVKLAKGAKRVEGREFNLRLGSGGPLPGSRGPVRRIALMRFLDELTQLPEHLAARSHGIGRLLQVSAGGVRVGLRKEVDEPLLAGRTSAGASSLGCLR